MVESINALTLLKEEMQTEEIHLKVNAIHRLKTVILSIGINDTNTQLIPYLECKQSAPVALPSLIASPPCSPHPGAGRRSALRHRRGTRQHLVSKSASD